MKKYFIASWKYFKYVMRHKWYVFLECCKLGIPFRGIIHDWSKFRPCEWNSYLLNFFLNEKQDPFVGWVHHTHVNKHHWNYWIDYDYDIDLWAKAKPIKMPLKYAKEMLADWRAMSRAFGQNDPADWFVGQFDEGKIVLHPDTLDWITEQLKVPVTIINVWHKNEISSATKSHR